MVVRGCALSRREERGASAVEFALVLPIFLALVFGVISYGYMLAYRQAVSQGAIEAARAAAIKPAVYSDADRSSDALTAIEETLAPYGVSCASAGVMCSVDVGAPVVRVTVTHAYRDHPLIPAFPGLGVVLPETITYTAAIERS